VIVVAGVRLSGPTSKALHSELLTELLSQFSSRNELRKPNISETRENEMFGKFGLTQGLTNKHAHFLALSYVKYFVEKHLYKYYPKSYI
jgi:hypothetical protein